MDRKPTMMNKEWDDHLARIEWMMKRIYDLENRVQALENPENEYEE